MIISQARFLQFDLGRNPLNPLPESVDSPRQQRGCLLTLTPNSFWPAPYDFPNTFWWARFFLVMATSV
jgi:hypothetical protein